MRPTQLDSWVLNKRRDKRVFIKRRAVKNYICGTIVNKRRDVKTVSNKRRGVEKIQLC